ncbi:MAG: GNAT family N-acetyltransferase [Actinomycetota bacterium]|nr:GNAT family N-acetyltransferase [Actinomycetota bacterium]
MRLCATGQFGAVRRVLQRWLYSDRVAVCLRRDLSTPVRTRSPSVRLTVRPLRPEDVPALVELPKGDGRTADALVRINARHLLDSGLATCYVTETDDGEVCYMQYLVLPDQNEKLQSVFGGLMPPLAADEALLEFAFTLEPYRARGVMPYAMAQLADEARRQGARWLLTYVDKHEKLLLRFYERMGFSPYRLRRESYRFLRRRVAVTPVAA